MSAWGRSPRLTDLIRSRHGSCTRQSKGNSMQQADFVIVGSGSAGSALAYRLSEDGKNTVIVIEAGGSDFGPFIQMPAALAWPMSMKRYNWGYLSEPEPHLNNRRITA